MRYPHRSCGAVGILASLCLTATVVFAHQTGATSPDPQPRYTYIAELLLKDHPLPFIFQYGPGNDIAAGGLGNNPAWARAVIATGATGSAGALHTEDATSVEATTGPGYTEYTARFDTYGSSLRFREYAGGTRSVGVWTIPRNDGPRSIPLAIRRHGPWDSKPASPFPPLVLPGAADCSAGDPEPFGGRWRVDFSSSDDDAIGEFSVDPDTGLTTGTFRTTTGDYRYLSGSVEGSVMRLSTFDGAHAFLFHARMLDHANIEGDFWSGDWWHETWTATRASDSFELPDAFELTTQTGSLDELGDREFVTLDGTARFRDVYEPGAPTIIEVFGSWCPNCKDAGTLLKELHAEHGPAGLRIIGMAFERKPPEQST
ncbi:MAG: hypothetical protein AAF235_08755, partial [Planctomycetota bacterium]